MVDVCTVASLLLTYEVRSSNLSSFVYKFCPVDLCLCPFFNQQRHCLLPVKLSTVEYRRRVDVLNE